MKNILYKQSLDYNDINNKNIIFCLKEKNKRILLL